MKMFILTAEAEYDGGSPVSVIPARSRKSALKKIGATDATTNSPAWSSKPRIIISDETRKKMVALPNADAYVLSREQSFFSTNASVEDVEALIRSFAGDFLWVRRAGKEFVIRDTRTLEEAQRLFDPLRQLDPEREALRRRQERLGSDQAALDRDEEKLERELEARNEGGEIRGSAAARTDLERRRTELKSRMRALEARDRELEAAETSLEARSDALEEKAETALWSLIDRALTKGLGRALGRE